ncbi:DNA cytosine methyltransferase (plasmid) [Serratia marcescens]|uniref:DNA cytosine methyltransferase n=1 Tax=Serratia TaxID=613 RepID=UPI000C13DCAE|nr:DNA cytosine methyltransferase [Serratia marcescens]PHY81393.1 DNA cytosine methyltransferase [Serratia marcescens]
MGKAYYNEIDPYAAQWLRNLIAAGHIAPGDVDERSIEDVKPDDLRNYTQCHFFAGIGVWSYALRNAGWPDDKPVWTGSCPCQPFSSAGMGGGFDDERHLWPAFHWLIGECRPQHVFGEQVASGNANAWFDLVQADLEAMDYAFGLVPFPSAGVGAPHIRDRAYWVAHANHAGLEGRQGVPERSAQFTAGPRCLAGGVADANDNRQQPGTWRSCGGECATEGNDDRRCGEACGLADTHSWKQRQNSGRIQGAGDVPEGRLEGTAAFTGFCGDMPANPVNGFWRDADWLFCRDEKWRPVRPGSFPLVDGASARVGRLRAYGNAINAEAAKVFIAAYLEAQHG